MLKIRTTGKENYSRVREFYYSLINAMKGAEYSPGWEKDIYPAH